MTQSIQLTEPAPAPAHAVDMLEHCHRLVTPALREAVERLHPETGLMAAFAFGWRNADGSPSHDQGGKGLRPALAMLSAKAAGAPLEAATVAAAVVELLHAFSLVHDDIMDGDERRRHRATVWKAFGTGPAVLAGDSLLALALSVLAHAPEPTAAVPLVAHTMMEMVNGQAEDLSFETRPWTGPNAVGIEEYTAMAGRKTGSLLGCAAGLGALLGEAPPTVVAALTLMGRHLGLAFQAVDDLLGIWGDPAVTGKPVFSDLRRRKKTLPVLFALESGAVPAAELLGLLAAAGDPPERDDDLRRAATLIGDAGGKAFTSARARAHLGTVRQIVGEQAVDRAAGADLIELAEFVVNRTR